MWTIWLAEDDMWCVGTTVDGRTFVFEAYETKRQAVQLVNVLNGGSGGVPVELSDTWLELRGPVAKNFFPVHAPKRLRDVTG